LPLEKERNMKIQVLLAGAAAAVAAGALLLGGVLGSEPAQTAARSSAIPEGTLAQLLDGLGAGDTGGYVRRLERRVAAAPADTQGLILLGLAYQQRARETGDPDFFMRSERRLRQARTLAPREPVVLTGLAALASTRHRFESAIGLSRKALAYDPENAVAYGVLGDSFVELGRYDEAFQAYDRMAELAPGLSSYARVAHARELLGRPGEAIEAIELGLEYRTLSEHSAWGLVQIGNLELGRGRLEVAGRIFRRALARYPGYVHALGGLAELDRARGNYERASERLRTVVARLPVPEYATRLGDSLAAAGRTEEAMRAYALVARLERRLAASGVRTELETSLFDLDHDRDYANALVRARRAFEARPGLEAEHVLAWAFYKNGRCEEARRHSISALRLGTKDLDALYHRSLIESCLGNRSGAESFLARVQAIDPYYLRNAPSPARIGQDA
jgi:tetratricopeptide (TPR) repeat protein